MPQQINQPGAPPFTRRLLDIYTGAMLTQMVEIGYRTGLFEAAAAAGPATCRDLAARAGLNERYVREWLGGMTTGGVFLYDAAADTYALPPEHAAALTGGGARNLAPQSRMLNHFGRLLPQITERFHTGGGLPYSVYRPEFTETMDDTWRRIYDEHLVDGFLGAVDGLTARLDAGIAALDIGCGTGHAINLMAARFPRSRFAGYDIGEDAIAHASSEADAMGLANVEFAVRDVTRLPAEPTFDLVTAFDAIHDQADPAGVLRSIRDALAPGGVFLMIDFRFSSRVDGNLGNPFAPLYYGISLMHCMPVSLAEGGAGLGAVWGEDRAREMLKEAGFARVELVGSPRPQNCIYVCRKEA